MKRTVIAVILMAMAGGAYAADFGQQLAVNAKDMKVISAENKNIVTPSRDASNRENGPVFSCSGSGAYWGFDMNPGPSDYVPQGYWAFSWPSPGAVKPVKPIVYRDTFVYQAKDAGYTLVISKCPEPGCHNLYQSAPQPYQIVVISEHPQYPTSVLTGTCVAK